MKRLSILISAILLSATLAQARFYIGIEGGYSVEKSYEGNNAFNISKTYVIRDAFKEGARGYSLGINLGSENFYTPYFGTRFGFGVGYTSVDQKADGSGLVDQKLSYIDTGIYFDLMTNLYSSSNFSFGIFGGVDMRYHYRLNKIQIQKEEGEIDYFFDDLFEDAFSDLVNGRHLVDFGGRVGISMLIASHHRIDLLARLPIASLKAGFIGGSTLPAKTSLSAGYSFVF